jgi:DNA-binding XRE family transcriptional regulator
MDGSNMVRDRIDHIHGRIIAVMPPSRRISRDAICFGAIIRRLRVRRGWTRAKLAQRSGLNATYVGLLERGRNIPSLETILELAEVLGVDAGGDHQWSVISGQWSVVSGQWLEVGQPLN